MTPVTNVLRECILHSLKKFERWQKMKILSSDACFLNLFFNFKFIFIDANHGSFMISLVTENFFFTLGSGAIPDKKIFGLNKIMKHSYLVTSELCSEQFCFDIRYPTKPLFR